uniref:Tetratricopeptide repeat domain 9C n=1 Tax=Sinocyclocheilus anshuiensis TaxID=1608454 RepID=A0A671R1M1_9TELE
AGFRSYCRDDGAEAGASSCLRATGESSGSSLESQLQEAVRLKTEGNAFYREKNVRTAIGIYHRALLVLRGLDLGEVTSALQGFMAQVPKLSQAQEDLLRSTQVDCYNKQVCISSKKDTVSTVWSGDIKALYRAGVASLELGDAQTARHYLTQASRGKPNDADVKKRLQRVEERLSQHYQKEKALYKGMFSKGADGGGEGESDGDERGESE